MIRRAGAALALAAGLLVGSAACSSAPAPDVRVAAVGTGNVTEVVEAPATVVARAAATVTAPATGRVASLRVRDGQAVRVGQVLLVVDSPTARAALAQAQQADAEAARAAGVSVPRLDLSGPTAQADAAAARAFATARRAAATIPDAGLKAQALAQVAQAEAQYQAARSAARSTAQQLAAGSRSLEQALSSLAEVQRTQTRAAVLAARRTVEALTVRAPISGTVVLGGGTAATGSGGTGSLGGLLDQLPSGLQDQARSAAGAAGVDGGGQPAVTGVVAVGSPVTSGQQLLTVTDTTGLSLEATVDETDVLLVRPGVRADVELDAVPGASYPARVTSIDLAPTTSSRGGVSYVVRLTLGPGTLPADAGAVAEPAPEPRPGMSAVARLRVRDERDVLSVPAAAVFRDGPRDAVWVVEGRSGEGVARARTVRLGAQGETAVQVVSGLKVGERIVVRGADQVSEGQRVG